MGTSPGNLANAQKTEGELSMDGEPQCSNYTDCDCRDNPSNCFCRGFPPKCVTSAWECHSSKDCKKIEKCQDKECGCHGSLCEHECDTANDCDWHRCNHTERYSCACKQSVCRIFDIQ